MKRVILSIIGGILLPSLYWVLLLSLVNLGERDSDFEIWVQSVAPVLTFPITWASDLYFYFFPPDPDFVMFAEFAFGNIVSLIIGNFLLYWLLTYAVLSIKTLCVKPKLV